MSFRINDITFRLVLYSRFDVVAVEVKVTHHPLFHVAPRKSRLLARAATGRRPREGY